MRKKLVFCIINLFIYLVYCKQIRFFKKRIGYYPNVALPSKYHEKMLWRKIFDHHPLFVIFCDKLTTKEYTRKLIPEIKIPETLWSGLDIRQAPDHLFKKNTIIKSNHSTNQNYYFHKTDYNLEAIHQITSKWLRTSNTEKFYESAYLKVKRTLFIEKLIPFTEDEQLVDIKIRCVFGEPVLSTVLKGKTKFRKVHFFDLNGDILFVDKKNPDLTVQHVSDICPAEIYFEAIKHAEKLSKGIDYARFDFMTNGCDLYAGEITVYPFAGVTRSTPNDVDGYETLINKIWDLRKSWFLSTRQLGWKRYYAQLLKKQFDQSVVPIVA